MGGVSAGWNGKSWRAGIGRRGGTRCLLVGGASLQGEPGGRGGAGVGLWSWMFLGSGRSEQLAERSVQRWKVGSGSQFYCPRHSSRHPGSWPSSRPTLRKTIVFLNTTTSSARTFSSELKQGTRERSGLGSKGQNGTAADVTAQRSGAQYPASGRS